MEIFQIQLTGDKYKNQKFISLLEEVCYFLSIFVNNEIAEDNFWIIYWKKFWFENLGSVSQLWAFLQLNPDWNNFLLCPILSTNPACSINWPIQTSSRWSIGTSSFTFISLSIVNLSRMRVAHAEHFDYFNNQSLESAILMVWIDISFELIDSDSRSCFYFHIISESLSYFRDFS